MGSAARRPEPEAAVKLAGEIRSSGVAVTLVVHEHKRLGRGIGLAMLAEELEAGDVGLEFLTGELKGSHDPSGIVFTVLAAMSGREREHIRDRVEAFEAVGGAFDGVAFLVALAVETGGPAASGTPALPMSLLVETFGDGVPDFAPSASVGSPRPVSRFVPATPPVSGDPRSSAWPTMIVRTGISCTPTTRTRSCGSGRSFPVRPRR
ncbi:recombinase family protein [Streptomyces sp. NPDC002669]|uniref:recombinase family protein n=1 Tax=Streptomyces sp. NPDC002669 TaxID=3364658 RepID=UPI0036C06472